MKGYRERKWKNSRDNIENIDNIIEKKKSQRRDMPGQVLSWSEDKWRANPAFGGSLPLGSLNVNYD